MRPRAAGSPLGHAMLTPLSWNIGFAIGDPEIDAQHRHLIVLINEIIVAVRHKALEKPPETLRAFRTAAVEHFRTENSLLQELRSIAPRGAEGRALSRRLSNALAEAKVDAHIARHEALLRELDGFHALPPHSLCMRLKEWFVGHAIEHDSRLRAVFQAM